MCKTALEACFACFDGRLQLAKCFPWLTQPLLLALSKSGLDRIQKVWGLPNPIAFVACLLFLLHFVDWLGVAGFRRVLWDILTSELTAKAKKGYGTAERFWTPHRMHMALCMQMEGMWLTSTDPIHGAMREQNCSLTGPAIFKFWGMHPVLVAECIFACRTKRIVAYIDSILCAPHLQVQASNKRASTFLEMVSDLRKLMPEGFAEIDPRQTLHMARLHDEDLDYAVD